MSLQSPMLKAFKEIIVMRQDHKRGLDPTGSLSEEKRHQSVLSLQKGREGGKEVITFAPPEDIVRSWPSNRQGKGHHQNLTVVITLNLSFNPQNYKEKKFLLFKSPSV